MLSVEIQRLLQTKLQLGPQTISGSLWLSSHAQPSPLSPDATVLKFLSEYVVSHNQSSEPQHLRHPPARPLFSVACLRSSPRRRLAWCQGCWEGIRSYCWPCSVKGFRPVAGSFHALPASWYRTGPRLPTIPLISDLVKLFASQLVQEDVTSFRQYVPLCGFLLQLSDLFGRT